MHAIHEKLAELNQRADALTANLLYAREPKTVEYLQNERRVLNAAAKTMGYIRLFDGRFRLSGAQVLQVERDG